ncbi:lysozyme-like domain-containing protein, partial [Globomyces pollinis-pini]
MLLPFLLSTTLALTNFTGSIPSDFHPAVADICRKTFAPRSKVGQTLAQGLNGTVLLSDSVYKDKIVGLQGAIDLFPNLFPSLESFVAFAANIIWESAGLSQKEELLCKTDPEKCEKQYGKYHGRGYIQLTGIENYRAFATATNQSEVMENPSLISSNETLAWASAVWFWKANCENKHSVGDGVRCINPPECQATNTSSKVFYQTAPFYRLQIAQALSKALKAEDQTERSKEVCDQMKYTEDDNWKKLCEFHPPSVSPVCRPGFSEGGSGSNNTGSALPSGLHPLSLLAVFSLALV